MENRLIAECIKRKTESSIYQAVIGPFRIVRIYESLLLQKCQKKELDHGGDHEADDPLLDAFFRFLGFNDVGTLNTVSHVEQIGLNWQNMDRQTEQTYPISMRFLWQKQAAL